MNLEDIVIRRMSKSELDRALDWAAAEGWNPGLYDAESFYAVDPTGFFIAERAGEPLGCVSAVVYDESFGYVGLFIVRPAHRGQGVGLRLLNVALRHVQGRNVGLDAAIDLQQTYARYGFKFAYRNIRHRCVGGGEAPPDVTELADVPFDEIVRYDQTVFPTSRPNFLSRWIAQPQSAALAMVKQGRLAGYGVLRACRDGYKIGPLFADDLQIADALFQGLCARAARAPVFLDTPEANAAAIALAQRRRMTAVFDTARMYTEGTPPGRIERCYGVTTFELG
ncbi:GNAT family N-acetyltransferase [Methylocystis sp. L43]|jgi:GNAT superfamily N-acetyltransferase|uniref:GNAT family N-acetyltransferase n=1 Tax=unclassified Methylocystis TaxID=2625913 RepID=UPI0018C20B30|nr:MULTISPECIES: GNAT family N-acetyltransferase [unclassified Methylocystis]MBG0796936.1 GNAT family N-acetyltransferase [Methylocystis sp. L43]MBG0804782.1 GNAT family N-acetyltransferase [Methylocystis sp. H15]